MKLQIFKKHVCKVAITYQPAFLASILVLISTFIYSQPYNSKTKNAIINEYTTLIFKKDTTSALALIAKNLKKADLQKTIGHFIEIQYYADKKDSNAINRSLLQYKNLLITQKADSIYYAPYYTSIARKLIMQNKYSEAMEYQFKAVQLLESSVDTQLLIQNLIWLTVTYYHTQRYEEMVTYGHRAKNLLLFIGLFPNKGSQLNVASSFYYLYYDINKKRELLDTALYLANKGLACAKVYNHTYAIFDSYTAISGIYHRLGNEQKNRLYLDSVLINAERGKHNRNIGGAYQGFASSYRDEKKYALSAQFADSALYYYRTLQVDAITVLGLKTVYKSYKALGNSARALAALEELKQLSDSISNVEKMGKVKEMEEKYNKVKNEKTITELSQSQKILSLKNKIYLTIAIALLLAILAFIFYLRQQALKHKQTIMETEQRLNRARMNPHFFFNALAALQSFAIKENDGKALASNLSKFSHIMRETLESSYKEYVTVEQEIDFLEEYIELQKIRFPQKFKFKIDLHEDTEPQELLIPSMILQPFIENSIEHGFMNILHQGEISIYFEKQVTELQITITDNGIGFQSKKIVNDQHISRASQIIKDRIYLLNIKLKTKARFSIDNQANGIGVIVQIYLPILYKDETINS
jgi:hypothetical protein